MRVEIFTFTASVLINVAMLGSYDKLSVQHDQKVLAAIQQKQAADQQLGELTVEFVEAPKTPQPRKPVRTKKISDKDSVAANPDAQQVVPGSLLPKMDAIGPSDQLDQKRMSPSQPPIAPSKPAPQVAPTLQAEPALEQPKPQKQEDVFAQPEKPAEQPVKPEEAIRKPSQYSPQQNPSQPVVGTIGNSRITTQALSRRPSPGVQIMGETSFEAMGSDMGIYFKNMKERIWLAWFPYLSIHYPKDFKSADVLVLFYLSPQGEVLSVEVLNSSGSPLFATFCMEAVKKAGPFGPVPGDVLGLLGKDELEVKFGFHFR